MINPGFGHGHHQKTNTGGEQSKHGIWHEQLQDCLGLAREHSLTVTGIHPTSRYGEMTVEEGQVVEFNEKPTVAEGAVSGSNP